MYKKVHYCSLLAMLLHRKVHVLYAKNLPAKLPGYGLVRLVKSLLWGEV